MAEGGGTGICGCLDTLFTETRADMFYYPTGDDSTHTYKGADSSVNCIAFVGVLGDEKYIACSDQSGVVTVFDIESMERLSQRSVSDFGAYGICAQDTTLYIGCARGIVVCLTVSASGQTKKKMEFNGHAHDNMWSVVNHKEFLYASNQQDIMKFNNTTGELITVYKGHGSNIHHLRILNDKLWSCAKDACVFGWTDEGQVQVRLTDVHKGGAVDVCCDDDGNLYTTGYDRKVKKWASVTREMVWEKESHAACVFSISIRDNKLYTTSLDFQIREHDAATGNPLRVFQGHTKPVMYGMMSKNSPKFFSASSDGTVKQWNVQVQTGRRSTFDMYGAGKKSRVTKAIKNSVFQLAQ